ncbi:hypothetical protein DFH08DRAFT_847071 [Mycena albidolilacea]|uniref:Uncharacterized protein n=1 Tax=Mycena albidolilacea TaxID=1033008 RepID=A0AAD7EYY1_9AGAR|nr:hypothetical protein DFH08DRAFT_847071 [Mycena albidolilacea]
MLCAESPFDLTLPEIMLLVLGRMRMRVRCFTAPPRRRIVSLCAYTCLVSPRRCACASSCALAASLVLPFPPPSALFFCRSLTLTSLAAANTYARSLSARNAPSLRCSRRRIRMPSTSWKNCLPSRRSTALRSPRLPLLAVLELAPTIIFPGMETRRCRKCTAGRSAAKGNQKDKRGET